MGFSKKSKKILAGSLTFCAVAPQAMQGQALFEEIKESFVALFMRTLYFWWVRKSLNDKIKNLKYDVNRLKLNFVNMDKKEIEKEIDERIENLNKDIVYLATAAGIEAIKIEKNSVTENSRGALEDFLKKVNKKIDIEKRCLEHNKNKFLCIEKHDGLKKLYFFLRSFYENHLKNADEGFLNLSPSVFDDRTRKIFDSTEKDREDLEKFVNKYLEGPLKENCLKVLEMGQNAKRTYKTKKELLEGKGGEFGILSLVHGEWQSYSVTLGSQYSVSTYVLTNPEELSKEKEDLREKIYFAGLGDDVKGIKDNFEELCKLKEALKKLNYENLGIGGRCKPGADKKERFEKFLSNADALNKDFLYYSGSVYFLEGEDISNFSNNFLNSSQSEQ